jgi:EmrB/QacA subfamily drug resistance transporter
MNSAVDTAVGTRNREDTVRTGPTLLAVGIASMMLPLTVTGTAVALTSMARDLQAGVGATQWVLNAYNVSFAACLLAAGSLADRFGRRRVLLIGVIAYMLTSVAVAVSGSILLIDIARAVQGLGAAAILPAGAAIFANNFEGPTRTRAFGVLGTSFGVGLAAGPLVAGALTQALSWRAFFLLNVLCGAAVLAMIPAIRESRNSAARGVDWPGLLTFSASLFLLVLALVAGPQQGWSSALALGCFAGSVASMTAFVVAEHRSRHPMFDLSLFRRPTFVAVISQPFTIVFGFVILVVYLPSYFQGVDGLGATTAGLLLLPLMVPVMALPLLAGAVAARVPVRYLLAVSSVLIAAGVLLLVTLRPHESVLAMAGPLLVFGSGVGVAFGVMDNAAVSVVPVDRAGMASGIFNTMRITGESIAVAGAAALLSTLTFASLSGKLPALAAGTARRLAGQATQGRIAVGLHGSGAVSRLAVTQATASSLTSAMHVMFIALSALALIGAVATMLAIKDSEVNAGGTQ